MRARNPESLASGGQVAGDDRRVFPRVSADCVVDYRPITDGEVMTTLKGNAQGLLQNISGGGVSVRLPEAPAEGEMLALSIHLAMFDVPVIALGKVRWVVPVEGSGADVGIEFWWVGWEDSGAQENLRRFIVSHLESAPPAGS